MDCFLCACCVQVMDLIKAHPELGKQLKNPSISYGAKALFAHGIFAAETRDNLGKKVQDLVGDGKAMLTVNDKGLVAPRRVMLRFSNSMAC